MCPRSATGSLSGVRVSLRAVSDEVPTLIQRMTRVMSEERARGWIEAGRVWVAGEVVDDPDHPTPDGDPGTPWTISPA
jgi:hypothetical protein